MNRIVSGFSSIMLLAFLLQVQPVLAQDAVGQVPAIERAETYFEQGLESFEQGDYAMAYRRFRLVYETFPLNRKTTAARLMAGKALYRAGDYRDAVAHLSAFVEEYPRSSYVHEARRTTALAQRVQEDASEQVRPVNLGILLPLRDNSVALTQSLFNGIRLAVEEHNGTPGVVPVRMIFRDSGGEPARAAEAAEELIDAAQIDGIIGPIFSPEAISAAAIAEDAGIVLVAPLATDEAVSEARQYVFQANPTITMRGRQMARYAVQELGLNTFGVIAEADGQSISERMAEGFQDEALQLGAEVKFFTVFPGESGWSHLPEEIGELQMSGVEAVYMPLPGNGSARRARAALDGLAQMNSTAQILGNSEWHGLNLGMEAEPYDVTYANDILVEESDPAVQSFLSEYSALTGRPLAPRDRRLPITGYDVTRFFLQQMDSASGRPLAETLRTAPLYEGAGLRIDFSQGNVNEGVYVMGYRDGQAQLLR